MARSDRIGTAGRIVWCVVALVALVLIATIVYVVAGRPAAVPAEGSAVAVQRTQQTPSRSSDESR